MNQIIKIFLAFGLVSMINLSCKKNIGPENETRLLSKSKNFHGKGKYNDILSNSIILEWSNVAFEAVGGAAEGHPVLASRIRAMMHIAMHDALNAIVPVYGQYAYNGQNALADPVAAAATAAHTVLKASLPDPTLDTKL